MWECILICGLTIEDRAPKTSNYFALIILIIIISLRFVPDGSSPPHLSLKPFNNLLVVDYTYSH